jgi:flagellar hook assembly protein FlgD
LIGAMGMGCSTTGIPDDKPPLPLTASLRAYPNPFRADVTFVVGVPAGTTGTVEIFDVRGRRVRAFEARAGETALRWDGHSEQGISLPQGIYFVRLRAGVEIKTQRVILIR